MANKGATAKRASKAESRKSRRGQHAENEGVVVDLPIRGRKGKRPGNVDGLYYFQTKGQAQHHYLTMIERETITIGTGPAGTGKTLVPTSYACEQLRDQKIERIIITRPAVEASEKGLGFLPGTVEEKMAPYLEPFKRIFHQYFGETHFDYMVKKGIIEIAPIEYLRGLTFENAVVILDEAQNTTPKQMKLFLTRIGEYAKVIITGDTDQKDIKGLSGLEDAMRRLDGCPDIGQYEFTEEDIVRSGIVREILKRYRVS